MHSHLNIWFVDMDGRLNSNEKKSQIVDQFATCDNTSHLLTNAWSFMQAPTRDPGQLFSDRQRHD